MAVYRGGSGRDDRFIGTDASDSFLFTPTDLTSGDIVVGGSGIDTLVFTTAGSIAAIALANVSAIERIQLADGANALSLTDAFAASAFNHRIAIRGGSGVDRIDASALARGNSVEIIAGDGDDRFAGGAGADSFDFMVTGLTKADTVAGGAGEDTILLLDGGTVTAAQFTRVIDVEALTLSNAATRVVLGNAMFGSSTSATFTVTGGNGNDVIDARGIKNAPVFAAFLRLLGGAGDDTIAGPAPAQNDFYNVGSYIDGGAGRDTVVVTGRGNVRLVYDPGDARAIVGTGQLLVATAATIDLRKSSDQSLGDHCLTRGFVDVDASASHGAVTLVGTGGGTLIGGAGNDLIGNARFLRGGAGADVMKGTTDFNGSTFEIREGDFAAGEAVLGRTGNDTLYVSGDVDFRLGTLTGIRYLTIGPGESGASNTLAVYDDQISQLFYLQGSGTLLIDVGADHQASINGISNLGDGLTIIIQGSDVADAIGAGTQAVVHGGGGDDTIGAYGTLLGEGGDDRLIFSGYHPTNLIDGGDGSDTLIANDYSPGALRLENVDQAVENYLLIRNVENVDFTNANGALDCVGSSVSNTLVGSADADTIDGAAGSDTIRGGYGVDTLTGGAGADRFEWTSRDAADVVTDFTAGEDTLVFAHAGPSGIVFDFTDATFDVQVTATIGGTSIAGADLVRYTAGALDSVDDVAAYLRANGTGGHGASVFVVAADGSGHTHLFYTGDASGQDGSFTVVADLGAVAPSGIALSDFAFI